MRNSRPTSHSKVCRGKKKYKFLSTQQPNKLSRSSEFILTLLSGSHKKPFSEEEKEEKKISL